MSIFNEIVTQLDREQWISRDWCKNNDINRKTADKYLRKLMRIGFIERTSPGYYELRVHIPDWYSLKDLNSDWIAIRDRKEEQPEPSHNGLDSESLRQSEDHFTAGLEFKAPEEIDVEDKPKGFFNWLRSLFN